MNAVDKNQYIIIGKYYISKCIMMSLPLQLSVFDSVTNEDKLLFVADVFKLLKNEGLDAEPLHEYFNDIQGITKEDRLRFIKKFDEKYGK